MTKRLMGLVAGMFACLGFVAAPARGTVLVYEFEGVVDSVVDFGHILTQFVQIGDTISGTVTVERDVPDSQPTWPNVGEYEGAVVAVEGQVGNLTFTLDTPTTSFVQIVNDAPPLNSGFPGPWDEYNQSADLWLPQIAEVMQFGLSLTDHLGTAFDAANGDTIPGIMPPIEAFHDLQGVVHRFGLFGGGQIVGEATFLQTIPEPNSAMVFLLGGAIIDVRARRRIRGRRTKLRHTRWSPKMHSERAD